MGTSGRGDNGHRRFRSVAPRLLRALCPHVWSHSPRRLTAPRYKICRFFMSTLSPNTSSEGQDGLVCEAVSLSFRLADRRYDARREVCSSSCYILLVGFFSLSHNRVSHGLGFPSMAMTTCCAMRRTLDQHPTPLVTPASPETAGVACSPAGLSSSLDLTLLQLDAVTAALFSVLRTRMPLCNLYLV